MAEFVMIAKTPDLHSGDCTVIETRGHELALFNVDGSFHALDNTCCHRGGPLGEGELSGSTVTCPWHGWQYDVTTGDCMTSPGEAVDRYEVRVEGDEIQVEV